MSKYVYFIDEAWLQFNRGLSKANIMDYFYSSQFYSPDCNNEKLRAQNLPLTRLADMAGVEYVLDEEHTHEPHLYVICKRRRKSSVSVSVIESFYVLDGRVHQCPELLDLLRSRLWKACAHSVASYQVVLRQWQGLREAEGDGGEWDGERQGAYSSTTGSRLLAWETVADGRAATASSSSSIRGVSGRSPSSACSSSAQFFDQAHPLRADSPITAPRGGGGRSSPSPSVGSTVTTSVGASAGVERPLRHPALPNGVVYIRECPSFGPILEDLQAVC